MISASFQKWLETRVLGCPSWDGSSGKPRSLPSQALILGSWILFKSPRTYFKIVHFARSDRGLLFFLEAVKAPERFWKLALLNSSSLIAIALLDRLSKDVNLSFLSLAISCDVADSSFRAVLLPRCIDRGGQSWLCHSVRVCLVFAVEDDLTIPWMRDDSGLEVVADKNPRHASEVFQHVDVAGHP